MEGPAPRRGGLRPLVAGHGRRSFVMNSMMTAKRGLILPVVLTLGLIVHSLLPARPARTQQASAPPDSGLVVVVYDGDTVKVRFADGNERKVRLIGIDSPRWTIRARRSVSWPSLLNGSPS